MIVSLRQWTWLCLARQILRAFGNRSLVAPRETRERRETTMEQFEQMMVQHADLMLRTMNRP